MVIFQSYVSLQEGNIVIYTLQYVYINILSVHNTPNSDNHYNMGMLKIRGYIYIHNYIYVYNGMYHLASITLWLWVYRRVAYYSMEYLLRTIVG